MSYEADITKVNKQLTSVEIDLAQCIVERDTLSAELERVKAERDASIEGNKRITEDAAAIKTELTYLKSRLPVNTDGDVVLWGDTVYYSVNGEIKTMVAKVITPNTEGTSWIISNGEEFLYITDCYSSSESCCGRG